MKKTDWQVRRRRIWLARGAPCVLLAGVGLYALTMTRGRGDGLPDELSVERLRERIAAGGQGFSEAGQILEREDLTEEQRAQAARNLREAWQQQMRGRIDEYHAAPEEKRQAVLDRHIDEFVERMREWEQRQTQSNEDDEARRERFQRMFGSLSRQDRKERSESRSPDAVMRAVAYFSAVRGRMAERGIEPPAGPWRGRGTRRAGGP